jgi:hypothetical protein
MDTGLDKYHFMHQRLKTLQFPAINPWKLIKSEVYKILLTIFNRSLAQYRIQKS